MIMNIGVISDTHDDINNVKKAIKIFNEYNVDYVIHAGDYVFPGIVLEFGNLNKNIKFLGVLGNNDGEKIGLANNFQRIGGNIKWDFGEITLDDLSMGIYHGTNTELTNSLILGNRFDVFIYGHTHKKDNRVIGKTQLLNPGSAHQDLQKDEPNKGPSVLIYDTIFKKCEFILLN